MLKIGLEKEMFLLDKNKKPVVIPQGLPFDECGLLLEARGKPSTDIYEALFSLLAEVERIKDIVKEKYPDYTVSDIPFLKVDRKIKVSANRQYAKGVLSYKNLYGYEHHSNSLNEVTSGVHVSFTNEETYSYTASIYHAGGNENHTERKEFTYYKNFDWAQIFIQLDKFFKDEISKAKRKPGFYELKPDGRIEYRSLPSNVDPKKLLTYLKKILSNKDVEEDVD